MIIQGVALKNEHLRAIGLITVNASLVEYELAQGVPALLGLTAEHGQLITAELPYRRLVDLVLSAYRHVSDDVAGYEELKQLITRATQAVSKRDQVVHSPWGAPIQLVGTDGLLRSKVTAKQRSGLKVDAEVVTVAELESLATELYDVSHAIQEFWNGYEESA